MHRRILRAVLVLICIFSLTGCEENTDETVLQVVEEENVEIEKESNSEAETCIYVHVCGHVANPRVYRLTKESRMFEAIEAAGGITEDAHETVLNLAEVLEDGQQIYIPSRKEVETQEKTEKEAEKDDGKINLNSASKEELMTLSGIGEVKAQAIISYREEHGGFQSIEELTEVAGIKDASFQKVKDQIKVK